LGHIHLGVLPNSKRWRDVVASMGRGDPDADIFAETARAIEHELSVAVREPLLVEAVRLMAMIPQAAKSDAFGRSLRDLGLPVSDAPDLMELITSIGQRLDRVAMEERQRTDFGELARRALTATLSRSIADGLPGLFDATTEDVRVAAQNVGTAKGFQGTARSFFTRLLSDTLRSWLDRTSSAQVGPDRRFQSGGQRAAFDTALIQYCSESTRIISEFSAGWYGKTLHREGQINTHNAAAYAAVAFKKITEEVQRKRGAGD
jgi:hypothetical protein